MKRLDKENKFCDSLMKTSGAADELISFTKSRPEPFNPDFPPADNPWIGGKGGGGGGCAIL